MSKQAAHKISEHVTNRLLQAGMSLSRYATGRSGVLIDRTGKRGYGQCPLWRRASCVYVSGEERQPLGLSAPVTKHHLDP